MVTQKEQGKCQEEIWVKVKLHKKEKNITVIEDYEFLSFDPKVSFSGRGFENSCMKVG